MQGKVNTCAKMKSKYYEKGALSYKSIWKFSGQTEQLFRNVTKKAVVGNHAWWRPLLSRCTACNIECHWRKCSSNIFSSNQFEITHNFYPTGGTTAISCPFSYHIYSAVIPRQANKNSTACKNPYTFSHYYWKDFE